MKLTLAALTLTLALPLMAAAQSPAVWRCGAEGRSYSDLPCDQGRQLALADSRPAADVQAARERAAQERRAADALLSERLQREATVRNMGVAAERPGARVKPAAKMPKAAKAAKAKQQSAQAAGAGIFRAVAPASPRKKG
jgi:hypothetical protein